MQAKEFLERVRRAEEELKLIGAKRRHYHDMMLSIGVHFSSDGSFSKPTGSSKTETAALGMIEMEAELGKMEAEYSALVKKAEKLIGGLEQAKFRQVLTLRYLCGWSWKSIRDEMDYKDEKSVYRCHGFALRELQKSM